MAPTATKDDRYCCSKCRSCHVDFYEYKKKKYMSCLDCGEEEEILGDFEQLFSAK